MIAVKLEGRLGNQLFQYAFAYASAKKLKTSFYLDKSVDYLLLSQYFNIERDFCAFLDDNIFSIKGCKNLFSHYGRWSYYYLLKHLLFLKLVTFFNDQLPSWQLSKVKNNCIYSGFFQSEQYFEEQKEAIKKQFTIKEKYREEFASIFRSLTPAKSYVTIHVRRGDYIDLQYALKPGYYHNAIKSIHSEDNFYIFVSDDPEYVKNEFAYLNNKYVSENNEIIDLQFLMLSDICILSGSSFSWWGAWLNEKPNETVIAPQFWLGQQNDTELSAGIIGPGWIKM